MLKTGPAKSKTTKGSLKMLIGVFISIFLGQWQSLIFGKTTGPTICVFIVLRVLPIFVKPVLALRFDPFGAGSNPATNDYG